VRSRTTRTRIKRWSRWLQLDRIFITIYRTLPTVSADFLCTCILCRLSVCLSTCRARVYNLSVCLSVGGMRGFSMCLYTLSSVCLSVGGMLGFSICMYTLSSVCLSVGGMRGFSICRYTLSSVCLSTCRAHMCRLSGKKVLSSSGDFLYRN